MYIKREFYLLTLLPPHRGQKRYEKNCQIAEKKDLTVISETKKGKNEKTSIYIVTTRTTNPANLHRQNVLRSNLLIRPILHLQDHRAALESPQRVPLTSWNIQRTNRSAS